MKRTLTITDSRVVWYLGSYLVGAFSIVRHDAHGYAILKDGNSYTFPVDLEASRLSGTLVSIYNPNEAVQRWRWRYSK